MFTGIIEELGTVQSLDMRAAGARLRDRAAATVLEDAMPGASIAVNGVCLTAADLRPDSFAADLAPETLRRSNLGDLRRRLARQPGAPALAHRPRLSGHIVQGHVDGTGEFLSLEALGDDNWWLRVRVPADLDRYLVYKGSIAIDGISLTVAALDGAVVSAAIIPHTYQHTALRAANPGWRVNVEADLIAKYLEKLVAR